MDTLIGITGADFVLMAADCPAARSILVFKQDADKITVLDDHKLLANAGDVSDRNNFTEYIQKNMALYELNNDVQLNTAAAANFIRDELSYALRKGPYQTNLLLGGFDKPEGGRLYWCDYMGCMHKVNFGSHGHGSNFILSVLDRQWKPDMTLDDAIACAKACIAELQT